MTEDQIRYIASLKAWSKEARATVEPMFLSITSKGFFSSKLKEASSEALKVYDHIDWLISFIEMQNLVKFDNPEALIHSLQLLSRPHKSRKP